MRKVSDKVLRRLKAGHEDAFDFVVGRYRYLLYGIIYKIVFSETDAEDILVDVFQIMWDNIDKLEIENGNFHSWIITVAYNEARDFLRRKRTYEEYVMIDEDIVMEEFNDANSILSAITLHDMRKYLTEKQYNVIIYKDIMKMNNVETAKALNTSEGSIRRVYASARKIVNKYYEKESEYNDE